MRGEFLGSSVGKGSSSHYSSEYYYNKDMFGPICVGHLQVVTGFSDQLYRNAWGVLGGGGATCRAETCRCYNPHVILEANMVVFNCKY